MKIIKYILLGFVLSLWVIGCTYAPKIDEPIVVSDPIVAEPVAVVEDKNKIKHSVGNSAVVSLWAQSKSAQAKGDLATAIIHMERALRLEGEDPILWSRLAELHLNQGNSNQAQEMATKSNSLAAGESNTTLLYRNWLIIANARRLLGDLAGADEAEYTAGIYR